MILVIVIHGRGPWLGGVIRLCRKYSVQRLFAFGSAIRDDFRPDESDIGLLVEFAPIGGHAKFHAYFEMLDELQRVLGDDAYLHDAYVGLREKGSAVEREFIIIGEATSTLSRFSPETFNRLSDGRKTIGFRNILTHNYDSVDHETVYETALQDIPKLREECVEMLREADVTSR